MSIPRWARILDELEVRVEAHRTVLLGANALERYELPADVGPLPLELVGRACTILQRQRELEDELATHMAALRSLFAPPTSMPALYFDQSA